MCLCLTSHQQLCSYGDGTTTYVSTLNTDEARNQPAIPGLQGKWLIHYTTAAPIYPEQTDRIGSVGSGSTLTESILSTEWQCLENKTDLYKAITLSKYVMLLTLTCRNLSTDVYRPSHGCYTV